MLCKSDKPSIMIIIKILNKMFEGPRNCQKLPGSYADIYESSI